MIEIAARQSANRVLSVEYCRIYYCVVVSHKIIIFGKKIFGLTKVDRGKTFAAHEK